MAESVDGQLGKPGEHVVADPRTHRAHDRHPLGEEPACDEADDLCGCLVEPLGVVDDADERLLLGGVGEQCQRRQSDEEPLRRRADAHPEDGLERLALRGRQSVETIQHA
ncbi:MAG TPA: hypothetical protein VFX80_06115, partial [Solirubrobacteraceae bacterium]|nr:hypothetical protein [Solirubrobacteraceae bacterium]